jgi:hypothetical protein
MTRNWPTREEWAERRRSPYWDCETGCPFADSYGHSLSDYATADEIAAAIVGLEERWRQHGRRMRELKAKGSPLYLQPGESRSVWYRRYDQMSDADQGAACEPDELKTYRCVIKKTLTRLRNDQLPDHWAWELDQEAKKLIAPFKARSEAAFKAAEEEWRRQCAITANDDAAWEAELRWRRKCDDDAAHPERFIHFV